MACRLVCARLVLVAVPWIAQNSLADEWWGEDKALHFVGTAALSTVVTVATTQPAYGFWSGVAVGAAKELWDRRQEGHQASGKDFLWSVAGAYAGAQGGRWIISRSGGQTIVGYSWRY